MGAPILWLLAPPKQVPIHIVTPLVNLEGGAMTIHSVGGRHATMKSLQQVRVTLM